MFVFETKTDVSQTPPPPNPPSTHFPHPTIKTLYGVMIPILLTSTSHLLSFMKISRTVLKLNSWQDFHIKKKVHVGRVTVLCTLSNDA